MRGRQNFNVSQDVPDDSLQYVRYIETIVRLDRDEDGIAERYRAIMLGDGPEPLALLPGDDCYYIVASPYRRPHEPIGNGAVEEAIDLQDQMTALVRGWINNMNRANEPREIVSSSDLIGYESLKIAIFWPDPLGCAAGNRHPYYPVHRRPECSATTIFRGPIGFAVWHYRCQSGSGS